MSADRNLSAQQIADGLSMERFLSAYQPVIEKLRTEKGETMTKQQPEFTTAVYWRAGPGESWIETLSVDEPIMESLAEARGWTDFTNEQAIGRELLLIEQNAGRYITAVLTARVESAGIHVVIA